MLYHFNSCSVLLFYENDYVTIHPAHSESGSRPCRTLILTSLMCAPPGHTCRLLMRLAFLEPKINWWQLIWVLLKGEVLGSNNAKRINNIHIWPGGAHMRRVRISALQDCAGFRVSGMGCYRFVFDERSPGTSKAGGFYSCSWWKWCHRP